MVTTYHDKILLTAHDYQPVSSEIIEGRGRGGGVRARYVFFLTLMVKMCFHFHPLTVFFLFGGILYGNVFLI